MRIVIAEYVESVSPSKMVSSYAGSVPIRRRKVIAKARKEMQGKERVFINIVLTEKEVDRIGDGNVVNYEDNEKIIQIVGYGDEDLPPTD